MPTHAEKTTTASDRIRLPFSYDVEEMQREVDALQLDDFVYYDVMPLRLPVHLVDPSRPLPPPADNYADGSWTDWLDTGALRRSPYLTSIVDDFREHATVTLVRLLRLEPSFVVKEQTEPTLGL